jgi:hypothetical protein
MYRQIMENPRQPTAHFIAQFAPGLDLAACPARPKTWAKAAVTPIADPWDIAEPMPPPPCTPRSWSGSTRRAGGAWGLLVD